MLFKYRSIEDMFYVLDIIINQRLYATTFDQMNDPMEGIYTGQQHFNDNELEALDRYRGSIKLCSLSRVHDNPLMWSHYTNGSRGVVIELELDWNSDDIDICNVCYGTNFELQHNSNIDQQLAKEVLSHKASFWHYEEEVRVFTDRNFIPIKVKRIIFGEKVDEERKNMLKKIIKSFDSSIQIKEWDENSLYVHTQPVEDLSQLKATQGLTPEDLYRSTGKKPTVKGKKRYIKNILRVARFNIRNWLSYK